MKTWKFAPGDVKIAKDVKWFHTLEREKHENSHPIEGENVKNVKIHSRTCENLVKAWRFTQRSLTVAKDVKIHPSRPWCHRGKLREREKSRTSSTSLNNVFFGPIHCTIGILWLHGPTLWLSNFCGLLQIDSNLKSTYMWSRPYHEADLWSVAIYLARSKHRSYLKDEKLVITFHSSVFLKVCGWLPSKELQLLFQLLILLLLLLEPWKSRRVRCMERIEAPLDPFSHVPRYAHGTFMAVLFPYGASNMNSRAWLKQNCENGRPFISRTYCVFF